MKGSGHEWGFGMLLMFHSWSVLDLLVGPLRKWIKLCPYIYTLPCISVLLKCEGWKKNHQVLYYLMICSLLFIYFSWFFMFKLWTHFFKYFFKTLLVWNYVHSIVEYLNTDNTFVVYTVFHQSIKDCDDVLPRLLLRSVVL